MSFQAMTWAVNAPVESSGQRLVLLMLANHTNGHTGQCNPSHKLLAAECCMGVSTLKAHIKRLEEIGSLHIVHKSMDGVSLPNQYILCLSGQNVSEEVQKNLMESENGFTEISKQSGPQNLRGVGQNLTVGRSESDGGVGQNLAPKQEVKPGIKPTHTQSSAADQKPPVRVCAEKQENQTAADQGFAEFWAQYPAGPRKGAKSKALSIWRSRRLGRQQGQIAAYLQAMMASEQWTKQQGAFVPAPVAFLNAQGWDGWAGFDLGHCGGSGGLGIGHGGI